MPVLRQNDLRPRFEVSNENRPPTAAASQCGAEEGGEGDGGGGFQGIHGRESGAVAKVGRKG